MKKKDERIADFGLKQLGVTPQIYHFEKRVDPFIAITIADNIMSWATVRGAIDDILSTILPCLLYEKATRLREELKQWGIYGVSICDSRDQFNRRQGRTIAKGRLLKHLKVQRAEQEKKEAKEEHEDDNEWYGGD